MNLQDKIVVITGASQGLGKVLAQKVVEQEAKVALVARSEEKLKKLKEELGESAEYFVCDIANLEQVKNTLKSILNTFGTVDIVVNNAGVWTDNDIEATRPEKRRDAVETNVLGNIQFAEEVLPYYKEKNAGYFFNVVSTSGDAMTPSGDNSYWRAYGATKWALTGYTKALRDSLTDTKIVVTGFFPGGIDTNLYENAGRLNPHNQPWMMKPEDVADVIIFCLTRPADLQIESLTVTKKM